MGPCRIKRLRTEPPFNLSEGGLSRETGRPVRNGDDYRRDNISKFGFNIPVRNGEIPKPPATKIFAAPLQDVFFRKRGINAAGLLSR